MCARRREGGRGSLTHSLQLLRRVFHEACASQAGRSPVAVLCVDVPPADLDVNLEPNKTTVLLENLVRV